MEPVEAAAGLAHLPGLVFFDSSHESGSPGRVSVIAADPIEVIAGNWDRDWSKVQESVCRHATGADVDDGLPHGFAAGFIGYDGEFHFGIYDRALFFRHGPGTWEEIGALAAEIAPPATASRARALDFRPETTREAYCEMVRRAQEYIAAGDIYQVNLSHRFTAEFEGDPFEFYRALRQCSPAPFAAYLDLGERAILSASPELFLKMSGRSILTRPIKGTRPRRREPNADELSAYDLITSAKEIAELVMITDLERSDLGRVCEIGSIVVRELLALERYEQVFHLVSAVEGRLLPEMDPVEALRACFPGGSITGAPKKRAREIVAELEKTPRGIYTGAIGWFGFNGESQFSIAIRTVVTEPGRAHFHVGAGIVADSKPESEWEETLHKAAGILLAAEGDRSIL